MHVYACIAFILYVYTTENTGVNTECPAVTVTCDAPLMNVKSYSLYSLINNFVSHK